MLNASLGYHHSTKRLNATKLKRTVTTKALKLTQITRKSVSLLDWLPWSSAASTQFF